MSVNPIASERNPWINKTTWEDIQCMFVSRNFLCVETMDCFESWSYINGFVVNCVLCVNV